MVGKDILWFHTVIWLSLLLAADLDLPKQVFAHGFFTIDGQKISKSLGNVITPKEFIDKYGVDGARYLIISAAPFGDDRDIKRDWTSTGAGYIPCPHCLARLMEEEKLVMEVEDKCILSRLEKDILIQQIRSSNNETVSEITNS